jgi:hypothetical protein
MYESFLQLRTEEAHAEMLREATARQLVREARLARPGTGLIARMRRSLIGRTPAQRSESTVSATSRTPSSISDAVTCP